MSQELRKEPKKIASDDPLLEMMNIFEKGDMDNNPLMKKANQVTTYDLLRRHPIDIEGNMTPQDWIQMNSIRFRG